MIHRHMFLFSLQLLVIACLILAAECTVTSAVISDRVESVTANQEGVLSEDALDKLAHNLLLQHDEERGLAESVSWAAMVEGTVNGNDLIMTPPVARRTRRCKKSKGSKSSKGRMRCKGSMMRMGMMRMGMMGMGTMRMGMMGMGTMSMRMMRMGNMSMGMMRMGNMSMGMMRMGAPTSMMRMSMMGMMNGQQTMMGPTAQSAILSRRVGRGMRTRKF